MPSRNQGSMISPASFNTLIGTISAAGATPTVPTPLAVAAITPATRVPCDIVTAGDGVTGSPGTNDLGSAGSMLGARSGWVTSKLVSSTATRAPAPVNPASQAPLAWMARSPHWKESYGWYAGTDGGAIASRAGASSWMTGMDTFGTIEETPGRPAAAVLKLAPAATTKVPISGYAATIDPPKGAIAPCSWSAVADVLCITTSHVGAVAALRRAGTAVSTTRSRKQHAGFILRSSRSPWRNDALHGVSLRRPRAGHHRPGASCHLPSERLSSFVTRPETCIGRPVGASTKSSLRV